MVTREGRTCPRKISPGKAISTAELLKKKKKKNLEKGVVSVNCNLKERQ